MKYRAEIDGLRALAVMPVIFFHAGLGVIKGGFAGVDVFFVISGYLITSIISEEIQKKRFSILAFYERRARRIAPALLCVCLACLPFAWYLMLPSELSEFGRSLYHVCLSISNIFFWRRSDYFDLSNEIRPLLHTWSLAVEEQFYILFPLILLATRKANIRVALILVATLSVMSFLATFVLHPADPVANFYLLPTRFWELGIGAFLALMVGGRPIEAPRYGGLMAAVGLVLIILSYFLVQENKAYPGWQTVPVVIGTALVITFASATNWTGRLLSVRPLVFIGLISYSLYLWHQPVLAFARLRLFSNDIPPVLATSLVALIGLLAVATYFLVEKPFRDRSKVSARMIFGLTGLVGLGCIAVGIVLEAGKGFPSRLHNRGNETEVSIGLSKACDGKLSSDCFTDDKPEIAVWGDSFAGHLVDGIIASAPGVRLAQMTKSACGPFLDIALEMPGWKQGWSQDCLSHNAQAIDLITKTPSIRYVVVAVNASRYVVDERIWQARSGWISPDHPVIIDSLLATLERLRALGLKPVVFAPPPQNGTDPGACVSRSRLIGADLENCNLPREEVEKWDAFSSEMMQAIEGRYPVITPGTHLCDAQSCRVFEDGVPIYGDMGHYSKAGIKMLGQKLGFYDLIIEAGERGKP